jgi:hypothetical protein
MSTPKEKDFTLIVNLNSQNKIKMLNSLEEVLLFPVS